MLGLQPLDGPLHLQGIVHVRLRILPHVAEALAHLLGLLLLLPERADLPGRLGQLAVDRRVHVPEHVGRPDSLWCVAALVGAPHVVRSGGGLARLPSGGVNWFAPASGAPDALRRPVQLLGLRGGHAAAAHADRLPRQSPGIAAGSLASAPLPRGADAAAVKVERRQRLVARGHPLGPRACRRNPPVAPRRAPAGALAAPENRSDLRARLQPFQATAAVLLQLPQLTLGAPVGSARH
mmetsp:Transcript_49460/g.137990  ORF Transcript_49460/g.137990 Transcript_49460/m.137990 type:complete len:237 (+) Transcript_49460:934-1644(+)